MKREGLYHKISGYGGNGYKAEEGTRGNLVSGKGLKVGQKEKEVLRGEG